MHEHVTGLSAHRIPDSITCTALFRRKAVGKLVRPDRARQAAAEGSNAPTIAER